MIFDREVKNGIIHPSCESGQPPYSRQLCKLPSKHIELRLFLLSCEKGSLKCIGNPACCIRTAEHYLSRAILKSSLFLKGHYLWLNGIDFQTLTDAHDNS